MLPASFDPLGVIPEQARGREEILCMTSLFKREMNFDGNFLEKSERPSKIMAAEERWRVLNRLDTDSDTDCEKLLKIAF